MTLHLKLAGTWHQQLPSLSLSILLLLKLLYYPFSLIQLLLSVRPNPPYGFSSFIICSRRKRDDNMRERSMKRSKQKFLFTEDEILVAEILVDLPRVFRTLDSGCSFKWGKKKRRSRFNESTQTRLKAAAKEVSASASPVTPLAFSPSESDGKSTRAFKKSSAKKGFPMQSREEYCAMIPELSERRDLLRQEIGNVTKYYNNLIAYNFELKKALNLYQRKEVENSDGGGRRADGIRIPDLNVCAEEAFWMDVCQPLDLRLRRAAFAEARRRRMDIMKIKSIKLGRPR